jgi:O-antigen ligase
MIPVTTNSSPVALPPRRLLLLAAMLAGAFFFVDCHSLAPQSLDGDEAEEVLADAVGSGSMARRVAYLVVAGTGLVLAAGHSETLARRLRPMAIVLTGYLTLVAASVLWSTDAAMTVRRVLAFSCFAVGAWGLSRRLSLRDLAVLCLVVTAAYMLLAVGAELLYGTFQPWATDFRFRGTTHPNQSAMYCASLCLAAACLAGVPGSPRRLLAGLFVAGLMLLVLTRSRTGTAAFGVAFVALWIVKSIRERRLLVPMAALTLLTAGALVASCCGVDLAKHLPNAVLLGRAHETDDPLNGRSELWEELFQSIQERPVLGYGYGSFWNASRVQEFSTEFHWGINGAHSAILETALAVGWLGLAVVALLIVLGLGQALADYWRNPSAASAFLFVMLVYGLVHGMAESCFGLIPFLILCGLMRLAFPPQHGDCPDFRVTENGTVPFGAAR